MADYYVYVTLYGIIAVIILRLLSSRRFIKMNDIFTKTTPATLIADACLIVLLLTFLVENRPGAFDVIVLILFGLVFIFKMVLKFHTFSGMRHSWKLKSGFKSDYIFTEGETPFVYYNQGDSRWRDYPYCGHGLNLEYTGCGPTAFAMTAATLLNDRNITPVEMADLAQNTGLNRRGTEYEFMKAAAKELNIPVKLYDTKHWANALEEVKEGKLVIAIIHIVDNLFHYIIIRHVLPDGRILIADPSIFSDSIKPKDGSDITGRLHDEENLPTLCVLG